VGLPDYTAASSLKEPPIAAASLFALQEVDLALDSNRAALEEGATGPDEPEHVTEARNSAEHARATARSAEKRFKEEEFEADELRQKIEPLEQKLYQGQILNPRELEDLQMDIASLKKHRSELEDRALETMDAVETAQRELVEAEQRCKDVIHAWETEQSELGDRETRLKREISELEDQRAEREADVDAGFLPLYTRLRGRDGRAVAKVTGGACSGCRISLPMNLIQRARGEELVQCVNCERILYVT
jgi:predicted  nucleic acid-binding Zn-ribbon protein